jgi:hypothetical protein
MLATLSLFYSIDMIELLLPCGFDALEYSLFYSIDMIEFLTPLPGKQLILSICMVNGIQLVNTICLCRIIFCSIFFVVLIEMC